MMPVRTVPERRRCARVSVSLRPRPTAAGLTFGDAETARYTAGRFCLTGSTGRYASSSKTASISTGMLRGSVLVPTAERA